MLSLRNYTRVEIFLPLTSITLPKTEAIIATLRDEFGGITYTQIKYPSEFVGWYIGEENGEKKCYPDHIIWLMVDVDIDEHPDFKDYFLNFKLAKEAEFVQGELWIICYPVSRFAPERDKALKQETSMISGPTPPLA